MSVMRKIQWVYKRRLGLPMSREDRIFKLQDKIQELAEEVKQLAEEEAGELRKDSGEQRDEDPCRQLFHVFQATESLKEALLKGSLGNISSGELPVDEIRIECVGPYSVVFSVGKSDIGRLFKTDPLVFHGSGHVYHIQVPNWKIPFDWGF